MIPIFEPEFTDEDKAAVAEVLDSGWLNEHTKTRLFEETFAHYVGAKYAVASSSGTAAIFLALKAAGVDEGSRVAVPAYVAIGTVRAIQLSGAWAVLVDVDEQGNMDVEEAKEADASHVVAVHNNGYPCKIRELMSHFGADAAIEDACQSIGSRLHGRHLGAISGLGCFSLATTKIVTAGQGGVTVTNDEATYNYLQRLKNQGNFRGVDPPDTYRSLGYNFKWTEMQAALALSQMRRLPDRIVRMQGVVAEYAKHGVYKPPPVGVLPWRMTFNVDEGRRDEVVAKMNKKGVGAQPFPKPMHQHMGGYEFPGAEKHSARGLYLPSSFDLNSQQVEYVCDTLKGALYG